MSKFLFSISLIGLILSCTKRAERMTICEENNLNINQNANYVEGDEGEINFWEYEVNEEILTLNVEYSCGNNCQKENILDFDISQDDCITLTNHVLYTYEDGNTYNRSLHVDDFEVQEYISDEILVGSTQDLSFWIEL